MRYRALPQTVLAALVVTISATACSSGDTKKAAPVAVHKTTTTSTSTTTSTTTTLPPITAPAGLGTGSHGPEVQELETRLAAQKYDPGKVDGYFDSSTYHAVMAFQKVHGLPRTGRATDNVLSLIGSVGAPEPMLPAGGADRIEVSLPKQVLQLYKGGALVKVIDVSTGSGKRYCVEGECAVAVTPGGSYKVFFRRSGIRVSKLGKLWNPLYFNGGIAIHGAPSVPGYPASHGCVRIPMYVSTYFPSLVPNGMPVYVIGGAKAAVPFNETAPDGTAGTGGPATTTTTVAPTTTTTAKPSIFPTSTTSTSTSTTTPVPTTAP